LKAHPKPTGPMPESETEEEGDEAHE
jgi:hypothetical protein